MTKLVPVQRPDRNGKMVTRWVRPDSPAARKINNVSPAAPASNRRSALSVSDAIFGKSISISVSQIRVIGYLERTMPDVLDRLVEQVESDSDMAENIRNVLELHSFAHDTDDGNREYLENMLRVQPFTKRVMVDVLGEEDDDWTRDVMYRMEKIVEDMKVASGPVSEDKTKAMVLVSLMSGLQDKYQFDAAAFYRDNEADISYIADHIEEVESVLPLLKERKTFDSGVIRELIKAPSKAFTSGAL